FSRVGGPIEGIGFTYLDDDVRCSAVQTIVKRSGNRPGLDRMWRYPTCLHSRARTGIETTGGLGHHIRFAAGRNITRKSERVVSVIVNRKCARRHLFTNRRLSGPEPALYFTGKGGKANGCENISANACDIY